jgi:hypothetical protein
LREQRHGDPHRLRQLQRAGTVKEIRNVIHVQASILSQVDCWLTVIANSVGGDIAAEEVPGAALQPQATTSGGTAAQSADQRITELSREVENLKNLVHQFQAPISKEPAAPVTGTTVSPATAPTAVGASGSAAADVSINSFSLNQADLIVESAPDPATDKRVGMRLDLQYGQATSTLQGNPANELRPLFSGQQPRRPRGLTTDNWVRACVVVRPEGMCLVSAQRLQKRLHGRLRSSMTRRAAQST